MLILLGYTGVGSSEEPSVLYVGQKKSKALEIAAASTFPRITICEHPVEHPVKGWTPERAKAHAEATAGKKGKGKSKEPEVPAAPAPESPVTPDEPPAAPAQEAPPASEDAGEAPTLQ